MTSVHRKFIFAGAIMIAAVAYLAYAGMRKGWVYYVPVDQFIADNRLHGQRVRLMGTVSDANLQVNAGALTASFDLRGAAGAVRVAYRGAIPDMFKAGADVVVEGRLRGGVFEADLLLTKCASKYDESHSRRESPR